MADGVDMQVEGEQLATRRVSRRTVLRGAGLAALSSFGLAACGGGGSAATSSSASGGGKPKRGGTITLAMTGGTSADTLDPLTIVTIVDYARVPQLYDPLVDLDENAQSRLVLAEAITPNRNGTVWTIRLRRGVEFHSGKELTAEDVVYTLKASSNPKHPVSGTSFYLLLDRANIRAVDKYTVSVPCHAPYATFVDALASDYSWVVESGFNPKVRPNGTGPFVYESFTPGTSSTFKRNPNYWQSGLPYVDSVVIDDYQDETSQVNALVSGAANAIGFLSAGSIGAIESGGAKVAIKKGGEWNPFTMRVDKAPFNDVRVRQAFKLIVDRPAMLNSVFKGHGAIANDLYSVWDPVYDADIPQRSQDLEQAKFLLKKAGRSDLSVTLVTSPVAQGLVEAAQVFAQQAKGAGVTVNLNQVTPSEFFGPNYLHWVFAQDEWTYFPYFPQTSFNSIPGADFSETHYSDAHFTKLYYEALASVDERKRKDIAHEMQRIYWNNSGYIVPLIAPEIDGYSANLQGVVESKTGYPFNFFDFKRMWYS